MVNKLFTLLFTLALVVTLSTTLLAQEGSKQEEAKETPAHEKAEHANKGISKRWEGVVVRSNKDKNTLTVRKRGSSTERVVHYDSSTEFVSQEHGSNKVNTIDANDVKDNDRVICRGNYDEKGQFHATLVSKRLTR
jgi:hypothetical protein